MSSLIFAHAKSIRNKAKKFARDMEKNAEALDNDPKKAYKDAYDQIIKIETKEFEEILKIAQQLHNVYTETLGVTTENWYFITIRPDETKTNFIDFQKQVLEKFVNRKCFKDYTLTFEQKGLSINDLGKGFHCHIVANCSWRSKGEALRDTVSTFNKICAPNCIEIKPTRNPNDIITNYLIDYKSDDNHKEQTKVWDTMWRENNDIKDIYRNSDPVIKSVTGSKSSFKAPEIVEFS